MPCNFAIQKPFQIEFSLKLTKHVDGRNRPCFLICPKAYPIRILAVLFKSMQPQAHSSIRPLVYIVDDEPMIGELVGSFLKMEGMEVEIFEQPLLALATFQTANPKPDLLLTDFQMPDMSGLELIEACRLLHPELKTISISGTMTMEDLEAARVKPDRFVRKPFRPSDLRQPIAELLGVAHAGHDVTCS